MVNVPCPAVVGLNVLPVTPVPENVPPAGLPVNVTGAAFTQSGPTGVIVTVGSGLSVIGVVAELLQPVQAETSTTEIDTGPCPAIARLQEQPVTPVPENVPPAGLPVNVTGAAF